MCTGKNMHALAQNSNGLTKTKLQSSIRWSVFVVIIIVAVHMLSLLNRICYNIDCSITV